MRLQGGFFAVGCALTAGSGGAVEDTDGTDAVGFDWAGAMVAVGLVWTGSDARTGRGEVEAGGLLTELVTAAAGGVAAAVGRG